MTEKWAMVVVLGLAFASFWSVLLVAIMASLKDIAWTLRKWRQGP